MRFRVVTSLTVIFIVLIATGLIVGIFFALQPNTKERCIIRVEERNLNILSADEWGKYCWGVDKEGNLVNLQEEN